LGVPRRRLGNRGELGGGSVEGSWLAVEERLGVVGVCLSPWLALAVTCRCMRARSRKGYSPRKR